MVGQHEKSTLDVRSKAHDDLNFQFATASTVMLKNEDGFLPLSQLRLAKIGVVGDDTNVKGGGSGSVWSSHIVTPTEGLISRFANGPQRSNSEGGALTVTATPPIPPPSNNSGKFTCSGKLGSSGVVICNHSVAFKQPGMHQANQNVCTTKVTPQDIKASVELAKMVDIVIVNVAVTSTEGYDRDDLTLGAAQDQLVAEVVAANPNTIVVVRCPGAVLMGSWASKVKAILVQ